MRRIMAKAKSFIESCEASSFGNWSLEHTVTSLLVFRCAIPR